MHYHQVPLPHQDRLGLFGQREPFEALSPFGLGLGVSRERSAIRLLLYWGGMHGSAREVSLRFILYGHPGIGPFT
jgi:hypothetical protein